MGRQQVLKSEFIARIQAINRLLELKLALGVLKRFTQMIGDGGEIVAHNNYTPITRHAMAAMARPRAIPASTSLGQCASIRYLNAAQISASAQKSIAAGG